MLILPLLTLSGFVVVQGYAPLREPSHRSSLFGGSGGSGHSFLPELPLRQNVQSPQELDSEGTFFDLGNNRIENELGSLVGANGYLPGRPTKDTDFLERINGLDGGRGGNLNTEYGDYDLLLGNSALSLRDQEYLQPSSLWGHKYISGGAAELQKFKGQKPKSELKTDAVLPAYCNPPNPCPVGFTADDGCVEIFENTAAFSRAYQASQDCMCDTEHMFDCPAHDLEDSDLDLRQQQHDFLRDLQVNGEHKTLVAKKFNTKQAHEDKLNRLNEMAHQAASEASHLKGINMNENPFLQGEKLPIAAKKGHHAKQIK